jgi:hypothetical protein
MLWTPDLNPTESYQFVDIWLRPIHIPTSSGLLSRPGRGYIRPSRTAATKAPSQGTPMHNEDASKEESAELLH